MEIIKRVLGLEEYSKYKKQIPFFMEGLTKELSLIVQADDIGNLNMNTEQFVKYTEIKYWLEIIEYDLTCIQSCLIYLMYVDAPKNKENDCVGLLDSIDYFFFFDSALNKFFSLVERILQLINTVWNLELIKDKIGKESVTLTNIIKNLETRNLSSVKESLINIDLETRSLRRIRNAITHHYHPLNSPFYTQKTSHPDKTIYLDKVLLPNKIKSSVSSINELKDIFIKINTSIERIVTNIKEEFKIECVVITENIVTNVKYMVMDFKSLNKEADSIG
ncbi:Cthe_2314 family HEPN domain-containing protein [Paenibacillus polymyxa]|uniref:Cthe_2314 family HEPN domain-containing protein n=1 Tax=Paenibacillus polymyxa TaxID=1406 RepID=UPI00234ADFA9|nr:Cthe_2314 family HEPN domain-containing protein [Paenibacillus polymyxa]WCM59887.1 Cthe_2314 family HEPN domain-containing protein [Paenibacillus polymyxa]